MTVRIGIAGDLTAYPSPSRDRGRTGGLLGDDVETSWVASDGPGAAEIVAGATAYDGLWIAPGSPYADDAAVGGHPVRARARDPLLGTCGGLRCAVLEFARNVLGSPGTHAEIDGVDDSNAVAPALFTRRPRAPGDADAWDVVRGPGRRRSIRRDALLRGYGPTQKTVTDLTENDWQVEASAHPMHRPKCCG
ncbi:MAG: hypothetical protein U0Q10_05360 [Dermatophilaceae bacterium]